MRNGRVIGRDSNRTDRNRVWGWESSYVTALVLVDSIAVFAGLAGGVLLRFGPVREVTVRGVPYSLVAFIAGPLWLASLVAHRCYETRFIGAGAEEFKRVALASIRLAGYVAIVFYAAKVDVARGYVAYAFPLGAVLLLSGRYGMRRWLHARRRRGGWSHRLLAVGDRGHVEHLARELQRDPAAGYEIVGACLAGASPSETGERLNCGIPLVGPLSMAATTALALDIDAVAVTASPGISADALRRLAWELEAAGIDMVVAPALTDVAGPRIHVTPVAGLPLLHVDAPVLSGGAQLVKNALDRLLAALALLVLLPVMAAICLAIVLESGGPMLYRQVREGRGGEQFRIAKFRSMYMDADDRLRTALGRDPDPGEVLKLHNDPRITKVGGFLRRTSLDELPQLLNVVRGDMALVGPRPLQPGEATFNGIDVGRRNRLKPGITGLWQVSGRSDLDWAERARLDSYYVENWSLISDLLILLKTIFAVIRRRGAF